MEELCDCAVCYLPAHTAVDCVRCHGVFHEECAIKVAESCPTCRAQPFEFSENVFVRRAVGVQQQCIACSFTSNLYDLRLHEMESCPNSKDYKLKNKVKKKKFHEHALYRSQFRYSSCNGGRLFADGCQDVVGCAPFYVCPECPFRMCEACLNSKAKILKGPAAQLPK